MSEINPLVEAFKALADRAPARAESRCIAPPVGCGQPIDGFRDALSRREYQISGWCQACQDGVFVEPDEDEGPEHTLDELPAHFLRDQTLGLVDFTPARGTASGYDSSAHPILDADVRDANLITSLVREQSLSGELQHRPLLDVDLPLEILPGHGSSAGATQVRVELATSESTVEDVQDLLERGGLSRDLLRVYRARHEFVMLWYAPVATRETSPGKHHLYVDAVIPWSAYSVLLTALGAVRVLEHGYVSASLARGYTSLRLPWVSK